MLEAAAFAVVAVFVLILLAAVLIPTLAVLSVVTALIVTVYVAICESIASLGRK